MPALLGLVAAFALGGSAHAQTGGGNVTLVASEQLFDVFAAINVAGYDAGLSSEPPASPRLQARDWCLRRNPGVLPAIAKFYHEQDPGDPAANFGQYVSLALFLGPPPDFKFTVDASDLPPAVVALKGFIPLLTRFYREADLQQLWSRLQPEYDRRIAELSEPVRHAITLTDAYLRSASGAYLGRTYAIDLCPLGAPEQVQGRIYGESYYVVVTRSAQPPISDIRHQYLHFLLDPLAVKYAFELHQKQALAALARPAPVLGADFKEDFSFLVTECLIRAVELRMDKPARPQDAVDTFTREGLILVPYFYGALASYEKQAAGMSAFYRQLILGISLKAEQQRLANVKFAPAGSLPAPAGHAAPPLDPREGQLNQGDNLIYEGKYDQAKTVFEGVLASDARNERALFGMAVVASNTRKPDTAEEYLKRTLQVARSLRIVTWSHIYLGRLYDLEGLRKQALGQYQAAAVTATAFPDAFRAVQGGLARPFGSGDQERKR
ncbi:MAG TPA: tetratricopeptide repeat protein [Terriglobia bacterium]|nr:tetratricopeptide repeat protein [Terriglobia bacterium]